MRRITSFDPGGTTGALLLEAEKYYPEHLTSLTEVYNYLDNYGPEEVIYEEFRYRPEQHHAIMASVEVIGVIKYWCELNDITPSHHPPSNTKTFWTDEKIKKLGLWTPGMRHAMDAMRVMLRHREVTDAVWYADVLRKLK